MAGLLIHNALYPDSNVTLNFLINEDGKIHWDNENKNSSPNELIRPTQSAYTKPIPKVCIKERNENSEEISKSSEKNDKLMRLDDARELSRDQSRSTCGGGLRESIKFENSSFEVVDVQYNLVKTKDGSAVVENKCDMILHTNKNPLSDASPVESHFVVAVETAVSPNFQIENLQTEKDLEIFEQPDEIIEGSKPNVSQISDVSANAKNTSNTPNSKDLTHLLKFVVNCVDNVDTLHSSIENTLATDEIAVTTGTSECLKPDVNEEIISNCSYVTDNINFKKTNTDSEQLSEIENNRCDIKQTKVITPNNCPKLENSTASNNVQNAVTPKLDNHSKSLNECMGFPGHSNLVICEENVKHVIDDHINCKVNSGLDVGINSSLQKDTSDLVKDLAKVSFLYQGRLVRRSSESSVSQLEESTDECKEHNDDIIKKTYCNSDMIKSPKQHETIKTRDSNICEINSNNNNNNKMDHDHLESNKIEMSSIPKNNCLSDEESGKGTSDNVSRRSSSDVFDDSTEDGEDFLGTDEEVDMKNNMFTGFKEMSETLRSRRKSFHQLLNRLSESENEEWYISAGNLSMDFQKAESISSNNILLKQNHYVHHKGDLDRIETTKMPTKHNCSHKSEIEEIDDVSNYCASNQACKKLARQNHSHLNSKSVTVNLPKSHSSVTKNVLPLVINSNKKNLINEKSSKNPFIIKSHIDLDCNGKMYKGHSSMPDNKNQLDSENDEPISLIGEKFSPDPKEFETVNSQLNDEKSPRKYTFVNLKKNYDHKKDETKKDKIISSSTISDVIISSDKDDSNIELKFLPAVSKIKLHSNEKKGVKCLLDNNIDDTLSNLTSDHNQNQDILNKLVNVNDSLSVESDDIDEKQKDTVKRNTMLTSQETKLNSCQLSLTQHNLDKGNKIVAKVQEKSISFIKENQNSLKNENCDKIVINKQRERANVVTSTPTGRGENPLLTVDEEECSAFETSECELICKNVSSDERKSPYFGHTENEPNKCFKENSSVDHKNVGENSINEEAVSVLPKKRGRKPKQKTDKEANSFAENIDDAICKSVINDENSKSFKKRGRKPKPKNNEEEKSLAETNDNSFFETGVNEAELSALPKKRGRKPKPRHNEEEKSVPETNNGSVCENVINTEEIAAFPKKLGRKPKPKYSDEEHSVSEITNDSIFENMIDGGEISASPKKRGRKPKLKHRDEENSVSEINNYSICESIIDEGEISESPKKRGRKPKPKQREVENSVSEIKYDSVSEHLLNGEEISALPKKRGRKPKIKQVEANNLSKDNCKPILSNFSHEDNQNKINTSNPNISKNLKQNFTTSNKISDNLASTPKKRGRPPMNKSNNMINVSKHEGSFLLDYSKKSDVSVTQEDNEEILFSIYSEEADILLRSGSLQGIHLNQTKNSNQDNIITPASPLLNDSLLQNTIKRKRGRPPKIQYNQNHITFVTKESDLALPIKSNNSKTNDLKSEVDNTINHSFHKENILPKKRGRPFKQKLVACETVISEDDQIEAVPLSDRVLKSDFGQLEKRKRRPKLIFDNSDIGDEISSEIGVKNNNDMDVPTSNKRKRMSKGNLVDSGSELLDTDVIFINKDKLTDSIVDEDSDFDDRSSRIEEDDDDSDFCDLPKRKKRKRKVIFEHIGQESDEEDGNVKEKLKEKPTAIRKPLENQIFTAIHKSNDMVVCGVCKKEMRYKIYKKQHSIFTHYALCWIEGEEKPLDMKDDKEVVNRLWYSKKKLGKTPFKCFNCNLPKLSAVGFQSHIRFCGKEHEMENLLTTCPECGASMKPSSLRPHMYIKHSAKSKAANIDTSSIIPRTKRAAASKAAVAVIQHHKDEQEPEVLESESKGRPHCRPTSPQLKRMQFLYTKPNKIFPKEERDRCDRSLRETNVVACSQLGCRFSANTTLAFRKHYFKCPFSSLKLEYKCRQCEYVHKNEAAVQQHLAQDHGELLEASTGSESGSDSYEGSDDEPGKPNAYRVALPFKFLKHSIVRCGRGSSFPKKYFFSEALLWTHKMRCLNLTSDVLFPEAVEVARPLAEDQASRYIPTTTSSIRFRGSDGCWRTLDRFQGTLVDGIPVMFTGGPVWACAWASVPDSEHSQYLAVAPHPNMDQTHEMAAIYSYPSVIQVWALGQLTNSLPQPEPEDVPQFLMGIAHNRGAVWSLQWCPSGCHQDTRVGLLAAACSDGNVAIYSVPRLRPTSAHTIYEMEPVMELKLGCEMMSQCKCIEWHGVAPHSTIVGGFANGMVALWDLHTSSSLLRNGKVIYPFKVIEAHLSAVTAVSVSPTPEASGAHLMTASLDRATKFWRLDDTTAPVNTLRKASVTDAVMPDTWMIAINAYDDVYSTNATHIMGYSYRETFNSTNTNFQPQIGTVWGVSFNEWINAIACASEMGKLTVLFRRQLLASEDSKKVKSNSLKQDLVSCSVQALSDSQETVKLGPKYQDCVDKIGLDISLDFNNGESKAHSNICSVDSMENYPILSINKVTWNKNYNSFTWMAAGLQCGLVLAPRITCLQSKDFSTLYKHNDDL